VTASLADRLAAQLWPDGDSLTGEQIYAIVDAARDPCIEPMIRGTGLEHLCLFAGPLSAALRAAAPYVVRLSPEAALTRQLFESGWQDNWCVLACTAPDVTLQQLHRHFRTLLRVRDESGRNLMFRFYDPRILRAYLPSCTDDEARAVFGPISEFACACDDDDAVMTFACVGSGVHADVRPLVQRRLA
jgi:hypothetical protein